MDVKFFDSLYEGDSADGVKLCMGVTGGDFWPRSSGCILLYRGLSEEAVDYNDVLSVAEINSISIEAPNYLQHQNGETYFYTVRSVSGFGEEEKTSRALVKIVLDVQGDLEPGSPNGIYSSYAEQINPDEVMIMWYYNPISQVREPGCFNIYGNSGSGPVDYQNSIGSVNYIGRKYYSWQISSLVSGAYRFSIRAEDANGVEDKSYEELLIGIDVGSSGAVKVLGIVSI